MASLIIQRVGAGAARCFNTPCLVYNPSRNANCCFRKPVRLRKYISRGHLFVCGNASAEATTSGAANRIPSKGAGEAIDGGEGDTPILSDAQRWAAVSKKLSGITSNAQKHAQGLRKIRSSLGLDFGDSRTGVAISLRGYAPRHFKVLHLKGYKLIEELLRIASTQRADEFIVGLPKSLNGEENSQSSKTRTFAGRLAVQAALRGLRVYLIDEYGSSQDGLSYMLEMGVKKQSRKEQIDAYAAMVLLQRYFSTQGDQVTLLLPKGLSYQEQLCQGIDPVVDVEDNYDDI